MDEFDTIGKRITKIRQVYCDGKNTPFAERIGKDTSYSSQICNGTKTPGRSVLEEILAAFPEVSRPWLYFGEGKMLLADAEKSLLAKEDAPSYEKTLPLIPYDAFAGLPNIDNIGVAFKDCEQYYIPDFISRGADFLIRVSGDSMVLNQVGSFSKMPFPPEVPSRRQPPWPSWSGSMPFVLSWLVVLEPT